MHDATRGQIVHDEMGDQIAPDGQEQVCRDDRIQVIEQSPKMWWKEIKARSEDRETDRGAVIERILSQRSLPVAAASAGKENSDRGAKEEHLAGIRVVAKQGDAEVHCVPIGLGIASAVEDAGADDALAW